jgi:hypothetical protein
VGTLLVVVLFARLWRRSGVFNDIEFMELRYSGMPAAGLRAFKAVYQVACVHCIAMGWIFVGMQKLMGVVLGLGTAPVCTVAGLAITPSWLALAACAGLMFVYCEVSGLWGVVLADLLQFRWRWRRDHARGLRRGALAACTRWRSTSRGRSRQARRLPAPGVCGIAGALEPPLWTSW